MHDAREWPLLATWLALLNDSLTRYMSMVLGCKVKDEIKSSNSQLTQLEDHKNVKIPTIADE